MEIIIKTCPLCEEYNGVHACTGIDGEEHHCADCAWQMQCNFRLRDLNFDTHVEYCEDHKLVMGLMAEVTAETC